LERWRAGGTFWFEGHGIFYRGGGIPGARPARGGPQVLLLLHGFPTSSFDWHAVWEQLATRFRVVTVDMLGFGFSAKPRDARYSIFRQADLFEALARHVGVADVHLLAHDYGDTVALELLARNGERPPAVPGRGFRVRSVCLLNGGLFPEAHRPLLIQKLLASPLGPLVARSMSERRFRKSFPRIFGPRTKPTPRELSEFWAVISEGNGQLLFPKLLGYMAERRQNRARWVGALQSGAVPIRFINGLADPISGAHMVQRYRELVPDADVVELPEIGHYPQIEAPDAVVNAVLQFHDLPHLNAL
jgi:pimeloyl-ACP methyl ester carboxylesterase